MKKSICLTALVLVPIATFAIAQDKKAAPAGAPKDDPFMAKMMEFGTPGPAHKMLDARIGKWTCDVKMISTPGATPMESHATSEVKWILDGRFVQDTTLGDFGGMPFEGHGTTGYDNIKKKYVGTWFDNLGTGISLAEGTYDAATKTFSYMGEGPDVMAGKYVKVRSTEKWTDNDHCTMQCFQPGSDGKEFLCMEIHYTRAK